MDTLKTLVKTVARAFYDPPLIVILDLLLNVPTLTDEDLATYLNTQIKEVNRLAGKLKAARLIRSEGAPAPEGTTKRTQKLIYFIDYKQFVDIVKWKIHSISKKMENEIASQIGNYAYKCPQCDKLFSLLDVNSLSMSTEGFLCDDCGATLVDDIGNTKTDDASARYTKYMSETKPIVDLLRQTDGLVIPQFIPEEAAMAAVKAKEEKQEKTDIKTDIEIEFQKNQQVGEEHLDYYQHYYQELEEQRDTKKIKIEDHQTLIIAKNDDEEEDDDDEEEFVEA